MVKSEANIEILYSAEQIKARVDEMASTIAHAWPGEDLMIVSLLRGSFVFTADLIRALHHHGSAPQIDFMTISSYGESTQSSGHITIQRDISEPVRGKRILLVDDILESGRTLAAAKRILLERGAEIAGVAVFLEKPGKRVEDIRADLVGFTIPDVFVIGYGLDYANYYRELPYIGVLKEQAA